MQDQNLPLEYQERAELVDAEGHVDDHRVEFAVKSALRICKSPVMQVLQMEQ